MKVIVNSQKVSDLFLGNLYIERKLDRYKDEPMRRQLDAARKHLALEIRLKFP